MVGDASCPFCTGNEVSMGEVDIISALLLCLVLRKRNALRNEVWSGEWGVENGEWEETKGKESDGQSECDE